jgi:hypothetical protein
MSFASGICLIIPTGCESGQIILNHFAKGSLDRETREPVLAPQIRNILEGIEAFSPRLARLAYLGSTNKMNSPPQRIDDGFPRNGKLREFGHRCAQMKHRYNLNDR